MADFKPNPLWGETPQTLEESPSWWGDVTDNLALIYGPLHNKMQNFVFPEDKNFNINIDSLRNQPTHLWDELSDAKSQAEFANILTMNKEMSAIRDRLSINNSISAMLMAGLADPINVVPIPGAVGMGFVRAAKRTVPAIAGMTAVQEAWRANRDPTHTGLEAVGAIAGSAFFGGLLTGTIGHLTRGMNVGKIGSNYTKAFLEQEGTKTDLKKRKVQYNKRTKAIEEVDVDQFEAPLKIKERVLDDKKRPRNVKDFEGKNQGPDDSEKLKPVFGSFEKTTQIGILGRLMGRFSSPFASRMAQQLMSDMSLTTKDVDAGGVAIGGKGSVKLNDAQHIHTKAIIIRDLQDSWTQYYGDRTTQPSRFAGMPTAKWAAQIHQFTNSNKDKLTFEEFSTQVFKTIAVASDKTRTVNDQSVDFGKIINETPQIQESAERIVAAFKKAGDMGEEVGIFRTEDGIKKSFLQDHDEYTKYYIQYLRFGEIKKPTLAESFALRTAERNMAKLLNDMEEKEIFVLRLMGKKEDAGAKIEEVLETIAKRKEKNVERYNDIVNEEMHKKTKKKNLITEIEQHIKESLQDQKDILSALDEAYHTRGLTKNQLEKRNDIIKRLFSVYGLQDVKGKPIKAKGTPKQEQLLKDLNDQLNAPVSYAKQNYMKDLLKKIDQPATESQERYIASLKKTVEGTHFTKGSLMPANEAHYITRIWNEGAIRDNYDKFVKMVLMPYLQKSPSGKLRRILEEQPQPNATKDELLELDIAKENALKTKAEEIANKLIGEAGDTNFDNMNGKGQARFFMKRDLDMPNYHLLKEHNGMADFIETDIRAISTAYYTKFGPAIEMARMFNGDRLGERMIRESIFDIVLRHADEINSKGSKTFMKDLMAHEDDFNIGVNAVLGRIGNPATNGSTSNQLVKAAMQLSQMAMMGKVVIASLADPAKIILSRGMRDVFGRYFKNWAVDLDERGMMKAAKIDLEVSSETLNTVLNTARYRVMQADAMGNYGNRKLGKLGDKVMGGLDDLSTGFYNMNLLNSWTDTFKGWVGLMSADRILRNGAYLEANTFYIKFPKTDFTIRYGKGKQLEDGRYVPAFARQNEKTIYIDSDAVRDQFKNKVWLKPKVKGVKPLENVFETPDEWHDFVLLHEITHSRHPNKLNKSKPDYENDTNALAMKIFKQQKTEFNKRTLTPLTKDQSFDLDILRQYGLAQRDLIDMHNAWKNSGGKRGKEIYYSNVQAWGDDVDPDLIRKYTVAVRADQINTIITPTDADRSALSYGIIGRGAQRRQHNFFKMPIQFMSWSFAANNKIIISSLQGRNKGQMSGMVAMVALGFMSDYLRNPSYWKQKDWQEKIVKGVEYSGLTAYWLDISNTIEIMSDNKFGIRPMLGSENPFAGDLGDTISEPFGPLGSMGADVIRMLTDSKLTDNRRASIIRRLMPYNNLFYADWLFKGAQKNIMGM